MDLPANAIPGFSIGETLGGGARSTIYAVTEVATGKLYALKRVIKREAKDDRFFEQVQNEFRVSSKTDHPALRKSFQIRKIRKVLRVKEMLLLMEYVKGQTLEQHRPETLADSVAIFLEVARGLEALHQLGYVHADIKPNNIIVAPDGSVKLIDFGQSCPMGFVKERIQGTPDYIAPEQVRRLPLDQRTDVFNLGATLYWSLTGNTYPTVLRSKRAEIELVSELAVKAPAEANSEVPAPLSKLVMDCCQSIQKDRPSDMRQVIARLEVAQQILIKRQNDGARANEATGTADDPDRIEDSFKPL